MSDEFTQTVDGSEGVESSEGQMDLFSFENMETSYSDDGELILGSRQADSEPAAEPQVADPVTTAVGDDTPAVEEPVHDWEQRYKDAQSWGTKLAEANKELEERLARMEGSLQALTALDEEPPEAPLAEFDPEVASYIQRAIDAGVQERLAPVEQQLQPVLNDYAVQTELRQVLSEYPDFPQYAEQVMDLFEQMPQSTMSYADAYHIVKTLGGASPPTADPQQTATPQATPAAPTAPQPTKEHILDKLSRTQTETGQTNDGTFVEPERKIDSIRDAMQAVAEEGIR